MSGTYTKVAVSSFIQGTSSLVQPVSLDKLPNKAKIDRGSLQAACIAHQHFMMLNETNRARLRSSAQPLMTLSCVVLAYLTLELWCR